MRSRRCSATGWTRCRCGRISPDEIVGKNISFLVLTADGSDRYFNGHVQGIAGGESEGGQFRRYTLDVVPRLWFLTRTTDCRIFQDKSGPDITVEGSGKILVKASSEVTIKGSKVLQS